MVTLSFLGTGYPAVGWLLARIDGCRIHREPLGALHNVEYLEYKTPRRLYMRVTDVGGILVWITCGKGRRRKQKSAKFDKKKFNTWHERYLGIFKRERAFLEVEVPEKINEELKVGNNSGGTAPGSN
ncbi:hypothetical protein RUM44_013728 [Polyplax serrata]|uniref:LAGLIDADG homing endonuclease n=1 Tax=Polyplax serrata TaxID=468196 RepID=A0ABR1BJ77_POLSC